MCSAYTGEMQEQNIIAFISNLAGFLLIFLKPTRRTIKDAVTQRLHFPNNCARDPGGKSSLFRVSVGWLAPAKPGLT